MIKHHGLEFLTSDNEIKKSKDYKIIADTISDMQKSGAVSLGTGYCITMSEMIFTSLKHRGIKSKLVECTLTVSYLDDNITIFIGFENIKNPGEIDTHVVVITDTVPPFIIDASITNKFNSSPNIIIDKCTSSIEQPMLLADLEFTDRKIKTTYTQKSVQKVASMHQSSILNRFAIDNKIFNNLKILKMLIALALVLGTVNAARGLYDFYNIYIAENRMGPVSSQDMQNRLENIERLLIKKTE